MNERWTKWEPAEGLQGRYNARSLLLLDEAVEIVLYEDEVRSKKAFKLVFVPVASYRHTNETFRIETLDEQHELPAKAPYGQGSFFKVTNSKYVEWLRKESGGIAEKYPFMHYVFIDNDSILDIVAYGDPEVELVEKI